MRASKPPCDTTIAKRIDELRIAGGHSVRGLSLDAGLGPDTVRMILNGKSKSPSADAASKIAKTLGTTVAYLTGETDDPRPGATMAATSPPPPSTPHSVGNVLEFSALPDGDVILTFSRKLPLTTAISILQLVHEKARPE